MEFFMSKKTLTKRSVMAALLMGVSISPSFAADDGVLTGNTRLACEAVLCLSSGVRPGECSPALTKYFSIWDKKPWKMIEKRINFLNLCPASKDVGMPALIEAIGNGAGRCEPDFLNKYHTFTYQETICTGFGDNKSCYTVTKVGIDNDLPKYCGIYANHEWTYEIDFKYVGNPMDGGKWVTTQEYPEAKAQYEAEQAKKAKEYRWGKTRTTNRYFETYEKRDSR